jgi:hypothetical protein
MYLPHFQINKYDDLKSFIDSWSKLYSYFNEEKYNNTISKKVFELDDIQNLFVWKNGMKLSVLKQKSLEDKILKKLPVINHLKSNTLVDLDLFKAEFKELTAVWKIFLLHIISPNQFPIYDQHIHRTFLFIHGEHYSELSNTSINNKEKEVFYFERYLPFIKKSNISDLKKLDEAFFAFGQFLNTRNYVTLFNYTRYS